MVPSRARSSEGSRQPRECGHEVLDSPVLNNNQMPLAVTYSRDLQL
jgi:hypothetical protein